MFDLSGEIVSQLHKSIFHIEFNRPDKLNAFTGEMFQEFKRVFREALDSKARVIIISGRGRAFSAGADLMSLASLESMGREEASRVLHEMYEASALIFDSDKPVISAVQGYAIGSGFGIAVASDILVVSHDAILRPGYIAVGLNPEFCMSLLLPHLIGYKNAFKLLIMNEKITGEEAYRIGLAQYLVDKDKLIEKAFEIADEISKLPELAVVNTKKLLRRVLPTSCTDTVKLEAELQGINIESEEHKTHIMNYISSFRKKK